jgi:hypothetical protein
MVYNLMKGVGVRDENHTDEAVDEHRNKTARHFKCGGTTETRVRS